VLVAALLRASLAGCSSSLPVAPAPARLPAATGDQLLSGVCPATVVVQDSWDPSPQQSTEFALIGPGYTIDTVRKRVAGPLVAAGSDTGVRIEVRAGGPAIGFVSTPAQMYLDRAITLGAVRTDLAIATSAKQPVTAVVAPTNKSPQILMWDPASHPTGTPSPTSAHRTPRWWWPRTPCGPRCW
jgi:hypothetical protein